MLNNIVAMAGFEPATCGLCVNQNIFDITNLTSLTALTILSYMTITSFDYISRHILA